MLRIQHQIILHEFTLRKKRSAFFLCVDCYNIYYIKIRNSKLKTREIGWGFISIYTLRCELASFVHV